MKAKITVVAITQDMVDQIDLEDTNMTFAEMIQWLIEEEGLLSIIADSQITITSISKFEGIR